MRREEEEEEEEKREIDTEDAIRWEGPRTVRAGCDELNELKSGGC